MILFVVASLKSLVKSFSPKPAFQRWQRRQWQPAARWPTSYSLYETINVNEYGILPLAINQGEILKEGHRHRMDWTE